MAVNTYINFLIICGLKADASFFIAPVPGYISAVHTIDKNCHYNNKYDCQCPGTTAHEVP